MTAFLYRQSRKEEEEDEDSCHVSTVLDPVRITGAVSETHSESDPHHFLLQPTVTKLGSV